MDEGMKRRDFLTRVGLVGGAGALYGTMDALGLVASPTNAPAAWRGASATFRPPARADFSTTRARRAAQRRHPRRRHRRPRDRLRAGQGRLQVHRARGPRAARRPQLDGARRHRARPTSAASASAPASSSGQYMNAGPARIAGHMVTLDYCRELGVPIEVFTNQNADALLLPRGRRPAERSPDPAPDGQGGRLRLRLRAAGQGDRPGRARRRR